MKRAGIFLAIALIFIGTKIAFASPELVVQTASSDANENIFQTKSIQELKQEQIENVNNFLSNKISLSTFKTGDYNQVSEFLTNDRSGSDKRICSWCWIFSILFGVYLYKYAKLLKGIKRKKDMIKGWFIEPILVGIFIVFIHAFIHGYFASTIFLDYYWMIIFDELLIAYIYYKSILNKKKFLRPKKQVNKTQLSY